MRAPPWHVSAPLHAFPSLHEAAFGSAAFVHTPRLQTSNVHGLLSMQSAFVAQGRQPGVGVWTQPVTALHVSVVQAFPSLQLSGVPAVQIPDWQVSAPLHTLPSLHGVPFATAACWHPASGSQLSVVQGLLSLQLSAVPARHTPAWHVSAPLHASPSLHDVPFGSGVC